MIIFSVYFKAWIESFRLKTLLLAASSISVGVTLALFYGPLNWTIVLLLFLTASSLQLLSNLANDYGDMAKGSDSQNRIGPKRGMQKGIITPRQMQIGLCIFVLVSVVLGLLLLVVAYRNIEALMGFIILGLLSIIAAITYTVGNNPYGYMGLGDVAVLIFFGPLSVIGSFYLLNSLCYLSLLMPAIACGLLSVAVLNMNNLRDIETDKLNGKNTVAARIGARKARYYHVTILFLSQLLYILYAYFHQVTFYVWLFLLVTPFIYLHGKYIILNQSALAAKREFSRIIMLALASNLLFSLGLVMSKWSTSVM